MFNWKSIYNYLDNGTPAPPKKVEKSEEEWSDVRFDNGFGKECVYAFDRDKVVSGLRVAW